MTPLLTGLQVISFETRLEHEATALLEKHGARVHAAPTLRSTPLSEIPEAKAFAEAVCGGALDVLVLLTGVGASLLLKAACNYRPRAELTRALSKLTLVCRGPKPALALKAFGLRPTFSVPEPNTWREVVRKLDTETNLSGKRVWIQEYSARNLQLIHALGTRGALVRSLHVYNWTLPEDTAPLKAAILKIVRVQAHVALFTSSRQIEHVLLVAGEIGLGPAVRRALSRDIVVASVGPMTSEALERHGISTDIAPGHPKLGHLILAVARHARQLVREKREGNIQGQPLSARLDK